MQNLSYENVFELHENEPVGGTHFREWFRRKTGFDTEDERQFGNGLLQV